MMYVFVRNLKMKGVLVYQRINQKYTYAVCLHTCVYMNLFILYFALYVCGNSMQLFGKCLKRTYHAKTKFETYSWISQELREISTGIPSSHLIIKLYLQLLQQSIL